MFHFHKWSDWAIIEKGKILDWIHSDWQIGSYITQERFCLICAKNQIVTQKTTPRTGRLVPDTRKFVAKYAKTKS